MTLSHVVLVHRDVDQYTLVFLEGTVNETFGLTAIHRHVFSRETSYSQIAHHIQEWTEHYRLPRSPR